MSTWLPVWAAYDCHTRLLMDVSFLHGMPLDVSLAVCVGCLWMYLCGMPMAVTLAAYIKL